MSLIVHSMLFGMMPRLLSVSCRSNANRAAICRIKRKIYPLMYPLKIVFPNGATTRIRYPEPRILLQLPLDLDKCSPEERQKRLLRRSPRSRLTLHETVEDTFDQDAYNFLLKKK